MVRICDDKLYVLKVLSLCAAAAVGTIFSPCASAEMIPLSSDELSAVQAAGTGVQISLDAAINGSVASGNFIPDAVCADTSGSGLEFCRFGFQGGNGVFSWLLLKQLGGYFSIPKLQLYGTTVTPATGLQSALVIGMTLPSPADKSSQISVKDLYFNLAVVATPCDTFYLFSPGPACNALGTPEATLDNQNAYLDRSIFQGSDLFTENFSPIDAGKEVGFLGVRMNGNLNVGGSIIVFSK